MRPGAPALDKGLDLIEALAAEPGGLSQKQIAERVGRSVGEIFRMLGVLEQRGYVSRDPVTAEYTLTLQLFRVAAQFPPTKRLQQAALPVMEELTSQTGLSCHLAALSGKQFMVIAQMDRDCCQAQIRAAWVARQPARAWRWGYRCLHDVRPSIRGSRNRQPSVVFDLAGGEAALQRHRLRAIPQTPLGAAPGSMTVLSLGDNRDSQQHRGDGSHNEHSWIPVWRPRPIHNRKAVYGRLAAAPSLLISAAVPVPPSWPSDPNDTIS